MTKDKFLERMRLMRVGVTPEHRVMTDEYLDLMAERFMRLRIRELTRVGFEQYLECAECYEMYAQALAAGGGAQFGEEPPSAVILIPPRLVGQTYAIF
jgi:hypothetical protein